MPGASYQQLPARLHARERVGLTIGRRRRPEASGDWMFVWLAGCSRPSQQGRANGRSASSADVEMGSEWRATRDDGREPVRHRQCYMSTEPHHCIRSSSSNSEANHPGPRPLNCTAPALALACGPAACVSHSHPRCSARRGALGSCCPNRGRCTSRSGCAKSKAGNVCGVRDDDDVSWWQVAAGKTQELTTQETSLRWPVCRVAAQNTPSGHTV